MSEIKSRDDQRKNNDIDAAFFTGNCQIVESFLSFQEKILQDHPHLLSGEDGSHILKSIIENNQQVVSSFLDSQTAAFSALRGMSPPSVTEKQAVKSLLTNFDEASEKVIDPETPLNRIEKWLMDEIYEITGFPREIITLEGDFELDMGLDSISRMKIFVTLMEIFPELQGMGDFFREAESIESLINIIKENGIYQEKKEKKNSVGLTGGSPGSIGSAAEHLDSPASVINWIKGKLLAVTNTGRVTISDDSEFLTDLEIDLFSYQKIIDELFNKVPEIVVAGRELLNAGTFQELAKLLSGILPVPGAGDKKTEEICRFLITEELNTTIPDNNKEINSPSEILLVGQPGDIFDYYSTGLAELDIKVIPLYFTRDGWELEKTSPATLIQKDDIDLLGELLLPLHKKNKIPATLFLVHDDLETPVFKNFDHWLESIEYASIYFFVLAKALMNGQPEDTLEGNLFALVGTQVNPSPFCAARGFGNSLDTEWPNLSFRSIFLKSDYAKTPVKKILGYLLNENSPHELIIDKEKILTRDLIHQPIDKTYMPPPELSLNSSSVLVLTGGGSGITAKIGVMLAEKYRCKIIALGRTRFSPDEPYPGIDTESGIKEKIFEGLKKEAAADPLKQKSVTGKFIQDQLQSVTRQKAIHKTARRVKSAGGKFFYYSADLSSEKDLKQVFSLIRSEHGQINGLIHGAGITMDSLISNKRVESFKKVLHTKAKSAYFLYDLLQDEPLDFVFFFSSQASYTGNLGQSDYAAANEVLNAVSWQWNRQVSYPVKAILWSIWKDTGLASGNKILINELEKRGITGIRNEDGVRIFYEELVCGGEKDDFVLIAPKSALRYISELHK